MEELRLIEQTNTYNRLTKAIQIQKLSIYVYYKYFVLFRTKMFNNKYQV